MAVKIAAAMGAEVTLFSSSDRKREDAKRLGAHEYVVSSEKSQMRKQSGRLDFIIDTVSADHDITGLLMALRLDGTMVLVGAPERPLALPPFPLIMNRRSIAGSGIGGIPETQEMLDFCVEHKLTADVEVVPIQKPGDGFTSKHNHRPSGALRRSIPASASDRARESVTHRSATSSGSVHARSARPLKRR